MRMIPTDDSINVLENVDCYIILEPMLDYCCTRSENNDMVIQGIPILHMRDFGAYRLIPNSQPTQWSYKCLLGLLFACSYSGNVHFTANILQGSFVSVW